MTEDWKGEQFIRGIRPNAEAKHSEASRLSAALKSKAAKGKAPALPKISTPGAGAMSGAMRAAIAEQRASKRQTNGGAML